LVLLAVVAVTCVTAVAALRFQTKNDSPPAQHRSKPLKFDKDEFWSQFPVADYQASEAEDPDKRARRKEKGRRFDKRYMVARPEDRGKTRGATMVNDWEVGLPALPVAQSDLIVVGEIVEAQAHLSDDKTGVYSDFTVRLEETLKGVESAGLSPGSLIVAEREGGRVRYAPDDIKLYNIAGKGMPRVGRRYVLFVKVIGGEQDYQIVTGYELQAGRVFPLDMRDTSRSKFDVYWDVDQASFMETLRDAIAAAAPATPAKGMRAHETPQAARLIRVALSAALMCFPGGSHVERPRADLP
jgi:hypothetical protein